MNLNSENNKLYVQGTLTKLLHAPLKYKSPNGEKVSKELYYQVAIKGAYDSNIANVIKALYYDEASDEYIPKWVRGEVAPDDEGNIFYNFKSLYDLAYFIPDDDGNYSNQLDFNELQERCGNVIPLGSEVIASIRCKANAMYIDAIKFLTVKKVCVDTYFS